MPTSRSFVICSEVAAGESPMAADISRVVLGTWRLLITLAHEGPTSSCRPFEQDDEGCSHRSAIPREGYIMAVRHGRRTVRKTSGHAKTDGTSNRPWLR